MHKKCQELLRIWKSEIFEVINYKTWAYSYVEDHCKITTIDLVK